MHAQTEYLALNLSVLQDLQDLFNPYGSVQECRVLHRYAIKRLYLGNRVSAKGKLNHFPVPVTRCCTQYHDLHGIRQV